jgi:DNA-binding GntR family transcriptional regulator|tara:strand:+ start:9607 stop:10311 length:705 start_codon:yes stop_codon:yes gene_type:complete
MVDLIAALAKPEEQAAHKTVVEEIHGELREDIIVGRLPRGSRLKLEDLRARFKVSTSSVREALTRLIGDALVTSEGQKGFRVADMSLRDLADLTHARIHLECGALTDSIRLGDDSWEASLVAAFHHLTLAEKRLCSDPEDAFEWWELCNNRFHHALVAAAPSVWLERMRTILFHNSERYRRLSATQGPIPIGVHQEHERIFNAAISRNSEAATEALADHLRRAYRTISESGLLA